MFRFPITDNGADRLNGESDMDIAGGLIAAAFIFNLIFLTVGIGFVAIGAAYKVAFEDVVEVIPISYQCIHLFSILLIIFGCLLVLMAFFGTWGVLTLDTLILSIFSFAVLIIFIFQIAFGIYIFLEVQDRSDLSKQVNKTVADLFISGDNGGLIGFLQGELKCCGTFGPSFWNETTNKPFPESCCKDVICSQVNSDGCQNAFYNILLQASLVMGSSVLMFSASEVMGGVVSFCLINHIRSAGRRQPINYRTL